jgi:hypothetical protein
MDERERGRKGERDERERERERERGEFRLHESHPSPANNAFVFVFVWKPQQAEAEAEARRSGKELTSFHLAVPRADACEDAVDERDFSLPAGHEAADLREQRDHARHADVGRLAAHVGACRPATNHESRATSRTRNTRKMQT